MPRVARFSIAPVRSLGLQHPAEIELTERGVVEDRRFFLTNDANRLVDQLIVFKLVQVASRTDPEATTLWMRFPDGTEVDGDVELAEAVETPIHGRTGVGHRVVGPWAEALTDFVGMPMRVVRCDRPGGTRVGNPASILSDGSVRELAAHAGLDWVDARRFRMLMNLEDAAALIAVSPSTIYTQSEAGQYHFVEEAGSGRICLNSLFVSIQKQTMANNNQP